MSKRILAAIFLSNIFAAGAIAQEAARAAEFGRVSGGQIEAITKQPRKLSGSLAIMRGLKGFEATLGGTLVEDRLWFFASAHQQEGFRSATAVPEVQQRDFDRAAFAKSTAQLGDRHVLDTSLGTGPASFLSLRYDAAVSRNMIFSASFSGGSAAHRQTGFGALSP
jgi:hypothetical protein